MQFPNEDTQFKPGSAAQGCTKERRQHSKITLEVRTTTEGGLITGYGNRDTQHCYLDFLNAETLLGADYEALERYHAGYALRELYFSFMPSSRQDTGMAKVDNKNAYTTDAEIGDERDIAQTRYNQIMREVANYAALLRMICIDDSIHGKQTNSFHNVVHIALDTLKLSLEKKVPDYV